MDNEIETAEQQLINLRAALVEKQSLCEFYQQDVARLHDIIAKLKRMHFGPRAERWESDEQILLFNEVESEARSPKTPEDDSVKVNPFVRKRGKRKPLSKDLPREVVVIDLAADEKVASDGSTLACIGREVSEKLVYEPAKTKVIETHRLKYAHKDWEEEGVKIAPLPPSILPKSIATSSLLAQIVTAKFADGLPLYRQEQIFNRLDIALPRSTMARWIVQAAEKCQAIWNVLEERLFASPVRVL